MFGTTLQDIKKIHGCLSNLAMRDENAHRKPETLDRDEILYTLIPPFLLDINKLLASKAVRRLQNKTQVIPDIRNDPHIRNRRSHTDEVIEIATTIASILGLNVNLCKAIALGHDIGHSPFGHIGEKKISELSGQEFKHYIFSVVVAQFIERHGLGLNLTHQTLLGISQHSRGKGKATTTDDMSMEARVVMYSDKIAYLWSDISDIFFRHYLSMDSHPQLSFLINGFGSNAPSRTKAVIFELCAESATAQTVIFESSEAAIIFEKIKTYMHQHVYSALNRDGMINPTLEKVYSYITKLEPQIDPAVLLALMTDEEVNTMAYTHERDAEKIFSTLGVYEIVQFLRGKKIDFTNPNLDW